MAPGWPADGRPFRTVLVLLLLACAIVPLGFPLVAVKEGQPFYPDFFGLWTFGRFVMTHAPATIYDTGALYPFQSTLGITNAGGFYPFPYPPWILLLLAPLAGLPFPAAMAVWLILTVAACFVAVAAWRWPRLLPGFLLLAPGCGVCLIVGQNGFLTAALMLGGLRLLPTRPLLAGALLAAVAYKPQFAILLPFVLIFGGHRRAMLGGALATLALSLAATLAFGPAMWPAWLATMRDQTAGVTMGRDALLDMMPTITSAVTLLHGGPTLARTLQAAGACGALAAIWRVRGRTDVAAQAAVPLATLLASPYAFHYDLPMVTGGILMIIADRMRTAGRFSTGELLLLLGCIGAPSLLVLRTGPATAVMPALFAATLWLQLGETREGKQGQGSALDPPRGFAPWTPIKGKPLKPGLRKGECL